MASGCRFADASPRLPLIIVAQDKSSMPTPPAHSLNKDGRRPPKIITEFIHSNTDRSHADLPLKASLDDRISRMMASSRGLRSSPFDSSEDSVASPTRSVGGGAAFRNPLNGRMAESLRFLASPRTPISPVGWMLDSPRTQVKFDKMFRRFDFNPQNASNLDQSTVVEEQEVSVPSNVPNLAGQSSPTFDTLSRPISSYCGDKGVPGARSTESTASASIGLNDLQEIDSKSDLYPKRRVLSFGDNTDHSNPRQERDSSVYSFSYSVAHSAFVPETPSTLLKRCGPENAGLSAGNDEWVPNSGNSIFGTELQSSQTPNLQVRSQFLPVDLSPEPIPDYELHMAPQVLPQHQTDLESFHYPTLSADNIFYPPSPAMSRMSSPLDGPVTTGNVADILGTCGNKMFPCPFQPHCTHSFSRRYDLMRHLRIHMEEKPFRCEKCQKSFTRMDALTRHIRISDKYGKCRIKRGRVPKSFGQSADE